MDFGRAWLRTLFLRPFSGLGCALFILTALSTSRAQVVDLSHTSVFVPQDVDGPEAAAVQLLVSEVAKRTGVSWRVSASDSLENRKACESCILIGRSNQFRPSSLVPSALPAGAMKPEAFQIETMRTGSAHRLICLLYTSRSGTNLERCIQLHVLSHFDGYRRYHLAAESGGLKADTILTHWKESDAVQTLLVCGGRCRYLGCDVRGGHLDAHDNCAAWVGDASVDVARDGLAQRNPAKGYQREG